MDCFRGITCVTPTWTKVENISNALEGSLGPLAGPLPDPYSQVSVLWSAFPRG